MSDKYSISNDGSEILREGVKIAARDPQTGTIDYLPDMDRFRAPVTAFLREQGLDKPPVTPPEVAAKQAQARVAGETIPELQSKAPAEPAPAGVLTPEQKRIAELEAELARMKGQPVPATRAAQTAPKELAAPIDPPAHLERQPGTGFVKPGRGDDFMDPMKLRTYPDAPKYEQGMGDKTPAFVDWLFANHPDDAERRYYGRKLPGRSYDERMAEVRARQNASN